MGAKLGWDEGVVAAVELGVGGANTTTSPICY